MGNSYIPLSALLRRIGFDPIIPSFTNKSLIEAGIAASPEFVCLPFKINMGDLIDALDEGADVLAMVCGMWACRFGYYGRVQHSILRDMGYEFESFLIGREDIRVIIAKYKSWTGSGNLKMLKSAFEGFRILKLKAKAVDSFERKARKARCREVNEGETDSKLEEVLAELHEEDDFARVKQIMREGVKSLDSVMTDESAKPLRVKLVGELYMVLEPKLNFEIERKMGCMGVEVDPVLSTYRWILKPLHFDRSLHKTEEYAKKTSAPYIKHELGGEEHWTVAGIIDAFNEGYDGVVHVYPLTCMPENICRMIIPSVVKDYEIPVLNLCFDEHTSQVGVSTRLEAFIDLMKARRAEADGGKGRRSSSCGLSSSDTEKPGKRSNADGRTLRSEGV